MIVYSNMMVTLKPKGMMVYKWCCYHPLINSTKGFLMKEVQKYGSRETSESSLVSCRPKDGVAGDEPLLSESTEYLWTIQHVVRT